MKKKRPNHLRLVPPRVDVSKDEDFSDLETRAGYVLRFGPRCAGWLVNRFRKTIRRYGAFMLHLPAGAEEPPYFQIAIGYLENHAASRWTVYRSGLGGGRSYRIGWRGWKRDRLIPLAIVPYGPS